MISQIHRRDLFHEEILDEYLADGWFRSCQCMYRSKILFLGDDLYSPVRIRLNLWDYEFSKSLRKLNKKIKNKFRIEIQPGGYPGDIEKERLYEDFKKRLDGYLSPTLKQYLWGESEENVFDTYEVAIYDEDELVAMSFFDVGLDSIASILGVYKDGYEKYSLGFYTMLAEIEFAKKEGFQYYYPGYVIPGYSKFDYKLRIGKVDHLGLNFGVWQPFEKMSTRNLPVNILLEKLKILNERLIEKQVFNEIKFYPLFDKGILANTPELEGMVNPLYIKVFTDDADFELNVDFNLNTQQYELTRYQSFYHPVIEQFNKQEHLVYDTFPSILIRQKRLLASKSGDEILDLLRG